MGDNDVVNLCLENMTSTLELVQLKITKEDFRVFENGDSDLRDLFIGRNSQKNKTVFKSFPKNKLKRTHGICKGLNGAKNEFTVNQLKPMILMKTRMSTKRPDYPYRLLISHYKIANFRQILLNQLINQK